MTTRKDTERLLRDAKRAGAVVSITGKNHYRVTNPTTGMACTMSYSPSCHHALAKQKKDLRRIGIEL
jgi:hypothetical protein